MNKTDHNRLLVKIANLYYNLEMTQSEIGERLRLSRQKVQRLIRQAREEGVVYIGIRPMMGVFSELESALEQRFGLREALVVETSDYDDQTAVSREVGEGAAEYLTRVIAPGDKITISWGGSMLGMVNALAFYPRQKVDDVTVIQGLGGLIDSQNDVHAGDLCRRLSGALGAQAMLLHAPGVAGSKAARDVFYRDSSVLQVLTAAQKATLAFVGIGAPRKDSLLVREGNIVNWGQLTEMMDRGAVGDISLRYFSAEGTPIGSELDERVIGLTLEQLRKIQCIVGVAGGAAKRKAIQGALAGKLINVLITDHVTARHLVDDKGH